MKVQSPEHSRAARAMWVRVENAATKTVAEYPKDAELTELQATGVILRVPSTLCAEGHVLSIQLGRVRRVPGDSVPDKGAKRAKKFAPTKRFVASGKVTNRIPIDNQTAAVTVRFYQFNETEWQEILDSASKDQQRVNELFEKYRE